MRFGIARPDGLPASVMLAFLATAGLFYVNIMPALVDGLEVARGFSSRQAGMVGSANIYGAAAGALAASLLVRRLRWRRVAVAVLCTLICIDLASMLVRGAVGLTALRALDGMAGGFLVSTAFAVIARSGQADRVFGMLLLVQFGVGGLGLLVLPRLVPEFGMGAVFGSLILFSLATAAMLPFLAPYPAGDGAAAAVVRGRPPLLVCAAVFLFQFANMGLTAYVIGLGTSAGLARGDVSNILGLANWVGITGSLLVIVLPRRLGRATPLLAGLAVNIASFIMFLFSAQPYLFALANIAGSITWSLVIPYLFGLAAASDRTGQSASFASFASKMGLASGPLAGGFLVDAANYRPLIVVCLCTMALSAAIAVPLAWRQDHVAG
jgi:predicted MFS family arabinose efflux permease